MTNKLDELALQTFLDNQEQLFPEPVADTPEEAEAFCIHANTHRGIAIRANT